MVRTNQGGSVLSFVIIGVVMVALLVGGAYYVRQQTTLPPMQPSQPAPPQPEGKQPQQPEEKAPPASEATPEEQRDQPGDQQTTPSSAGNDTDDAKLPQSGPAELAATLLALGFLSLAAVSYTRSRRPELSL